MKKLLLLPLFFLLCGCEEMQRNLRIKRAKLLAIESTAKLMDAHTKWHEKNGYDFTQPCAGCSSFMNTGIFTENKVKYHASGTGMATGMMVGSMMATKSCATPACSRSSCRCR